MSFSDPPAWFKTIGDVSLLVSVVAVCWSIYRIETEKQFRRISERNRPLAIFMLVTALPMTLEISRLLPKAAHALQVGPDWLYLSFIATLFAFLVYSLQLYFYVARKKPIPSITAPSRVGSFLLVLVILTTLFGINHVKYREALQKVRENIQ